MFGFFSKSKDKEDPIEKSLIQIATEMKTVLVQTPDEVVGQILEPLYKFRNINIVAASMRDPDISDILFDYPEKLSKENIKIIIESWDKRLDDITDPFHSLAIRIWISSLAGAKYKTVESISLDIWNLLYQNIENDLKFEIEYIPEFYRHRCKGSLQEDDSVYRQKLISDKYLESLEPEMKVPADENRHDVKHFILKSTVRNLDGFAVAVAKYKDEFVTIGYLAPIEKWIITQDSLPEDVLEKQEYKHR
ncbi:hypothetical protein N9W04_02940 [Alphaproteobacteria bacterium]|nr:hypothetical protein [Alphaproteobacteria bacterium]